MVAQSKSVHCPTTVSAGPSATAQEVPRPDLNKRDPYVPSVVEAEELLAGMPSHTLKARRDRAMVAIAFLGALRADTVTSLRLKHLDVESRQIIQDGRQSRTKNGKSLKVCFFPVPPIFVTTVSEWKDELASLGFDAEDALFPHERDLKLQLATDGRRPVAVLKSKGAIEKAFKIASRLLGKEITPHAAKYSIGSLMAEYCTTPAQTKAWSQNMGHESVEVTLRHYHKLSDDEVGEIFEGFEAEPDAIQSDLHTAGDKDLLLAFHERRLPKDHPEYPRIKKLAFERWAAVD
ncbi:MAG: site-specific integrase [Marivivens sp.]|nr:site-specific integrase [Marivivens sp.]